MKTSKLTKTCLLSLLQIIYTGCLSPIVPMSTVKNTFIPGWVSTDVIISVTSLSAKTKLQFTGLFNHSNVLTIKADGVLKGRAGWRPSISELHISQEFGKPNNHGFESQVILSPQFHTKYDKGYNGEPQPFSIEQHLRVYSMGYGKNVFRVRLADSETLAEFHQGK